MTTTKRIVGIITVFAVTAIAWIVLGNSTSDRTHGQSTKLDGQIQALWGRPLVQHGPAFDFQWTKEEVHTHYDQSGAQSKQQVVKTYTKQVLPSSASLSADIHLDQRLKGLVWYSLFGITFDGTWTYLHEQPEKGDLLLGFEFPDPQAMYDDFQFVVNGSDLAAELRPAEGKLSHTLPVQPGQVVTFKVHYRTRGRDRWHYQPTREGMASLKDFSLKVTTDFKDIDYPETSTSPSTKRPVSGGWALNWDFKQVLTGNTMGVVMPARIQPGTLASVLAFSAPISLGLFFLFLFVFSVLRKLDIHPINYMAIAAAFFSFHLLFAYSVDHLPLALAFTLASLISIAMVVSYLRLVVSSRFAYREAAAAQLVYQVGFSLAHFWEGFTGLTVSLLATATLFILMQLTGRIKWTEALSEKKAEPVLPTTPVGPGI
jgi:inner membrane protein